MGKQVITKIQRLENKQTDSWNEFNLGAEASHVYVRNGDGTAAPAQSLLLKDMPSVEYLYGQDVWDANSGVTESLTWANIQKWLNEGRIRDFLKEGDSIKIYVSDSSLQGQPYNDYWHLNVIGINTHNGQSSVELTENLDHIDFCGGSMAVLRHYVSGEGVPAPPDVPDTFLKASSNNGKRISNNGTTTGYYGNFFTDNPFISTVNDLGVTNYGGLTQSKLRSFLSMTTDYLAPKLLYLDCREAPVCSVLQIMVEQGMFRNPTTSTGVTTIDEALQVLSATYDNIQADKEKIISNDVPYRGQAAEFQILGYHWGQVIDTINSAIALKILRYSVELDTDDFLDFVKANTEAVKHSLGTPWDSHSANVFLNKSVDLCMIPPVLTRMPSSPTIANDILDNYTFLIAQELDNNQYCVLQHQEGQSDEWVFVPLTEQQTSALKTAKYNQFSLRILKLFESLCEGAKKWKDIAYKIGSYQRDKDNIPSNKIWGLTEKELFGECTYSKPEYAQGQIFQYPVFQNVNMRKRIVTDLASRDDSDTTIRMITINPAEGSNTDAVGMEIETLMPTCYNVVSARTDGSNRSYPIDMPICFRIQQQSEIEIPTPETVEEEENV